MHPRPTWFRDPNVDVFVVSETKEDGDAVVHFVDRTFLPKHQMPRSALYPLQRAKFGGLLVNIPAAPEVYLCNAYGASWATEASLANAHSDRSGRHQLSEGDLVPALPTGPIARTAEELNGLLPLSPSS